jgi:hypothetical protein
MSLDATQHQLSQSLNTPGGGKGGGGAMPIGGGGPPAIIGGGPPVGRGGGGIMGMPVKRQGGLRCLACNDDTTQEIEHGQGWPEPYIYI